MFQLWSQKTHQTIRRINALISLIIGIASTAIILAYAPINWPENEEWLACFGFVALILWLVSSTQNKIYLILDSPRKFLAKKTFAYLALTGLFAVFSGLLPLIGLLLFLPSLLFLLLPIFVIGREFYRDAARTYVYLTVLAIIGFFVVIDHLLLISPFLTLAILVIFWWTVVDLLTLVDFKNATPSSQG